MVEISHQICDRLRQARLAAGLVEDDVHFQTRIPKSVVIALEEGNFAIFPSPTYARSFLIQYSEFLNVDARELVDALQPVIYEGTDVVHTSTREVQRLRDKSTATSRLPGGTFSTLTALLFSGGLIYAALWGFQQLEKRFALLEPISKSPIATKPDTPEAPLQVEASNSPHLLPELKLPEQSVISQPTPRAIIVRSDVE